MATGFWVTAAGAAAQAQAVDTVANNLANADTNGFKKDAPAFREYMAVLEREPAAQDIPRGPIKDKDFYPLDGRDQSFVVTDGTYANFRQGHLRVTSKPLDVAIDGAGFLEVSTPSGVRYTRQGSLKVAMDGRLVTTDGYPVLATQPGGLATALPPSAVQPGQGGPLTQGGVAAGQGLMNAEAARFINLRDRGANISITEQGEIFAGQDKIAQLAVTEFADPRKLRKQGGLLFENPDPTNVKAAADQSVIRQGVLETSNVNPIEEMTNLIKANRLFEQDLKAMKTYGELMAREANDIGKL
jgi:flagellar basal-body rod protein FlgF